MGCESYKVPYIKFSEGDDDVWCLCTFPHNDGYELSKERVKSLAYLGAAVVLSKRDKNDDYLYIPTCLPEWIRKEIDRNTTGGE